MKAVPTTIPGAFILELEPYADARGAFERTYCEREFAKHGLDARVAQCNLSWNSVRGTLRGLHYQAAPHEETKTVRVVSGAIYDVIVDLRVDSATRGRWIGVELSAAHSRALYVPAGFAHGFLTLAAHTVVAYQVSEFYCPEASRGIRWDDPKLAVTWPFPPVCISERDRSLPCLDL